MMVHKRRTFAATSVVILCLASCRSLEKDSRLSGHYENFSEAELLPYKGKTRIIPEFEESSGVMITVEAVETFNLYPLLEALKQHPKKPNVIMPMIDTHYPTIPEPLQGYISQNQFKIYSIPQDSKRVDHEISWTRDWAPWAAIYQPLAATAPELRFTDFNYYERRDVADELPQFLSKKLEIPRLSIPVRTEGGNFMINNRGDCMMTTGVIERENLIRGYGAHLEAFKKARDESGFSGYDKLIARYEALVAGSTAYNKEQINGFFRDYAGCKQVIWLAPSPADPNQHIDLFAKFLSDDIVLVMDLQEQTIATLPRHNDSAAVLDIQVAETLLKSVQTHLNEISKTLTAKGFKVVRAPLPLTIIYRQLLDDERARLPLINADSGILESVRSGRTIDIYSLYKESLGVHMRSYANSLIIKPYVYVPRFKAPVLYSGYGLMAILGSDGKPTSDYPDSSLIPQYEKSVEQAYGTAGLKVVWIDADQTVPYHGSIHCLTQQIGQLSSVH